MSEYLVHWKKQMQAELEPVIWTGVSRIQKAEWLTAFVAAHYKTIGIKNYTQWISWYQYSSISANSPLPSPHIVTITSTAKSTFYTFQSSQLPLMKQIPTTQSTLVLSKHLPLWRPSNLNMHRFISYDGHTSKFKPNCPTPMLKIPMHNPMLILKLLEIRN